VTDEERAADVLADWYERRERGEAIDPKDVVREHPEFAAALEAHFAAQAIFDQLAGRTPTESADAPTSLGEFRVVREIGRGGMGVVYEAEQTTMRRRVALKVLFPSVTSSRRAVERFQREARAAGRLHHTNIVPVHSMGEERGVWFYAMELVVGRPLDRVIEDVRRVAGGSKKERSDAAASSGFGTNPGTRAHFERVALAFAGVAEGLDAAHAAGIVHRDVKPGNLVLDADGTLRLMDFGLARVADDFAATRTGEVIGTPSYMSPEQIGGGAAVDARTDVYSLGATLYEALTLRAPFEATSIPEIFARIRSDEARPPRRADPRIPRDLETIVQKALEKNPARRYADAGAMAQDLRLFAADAAIRARRVGPVGRTWRRVKRHKTLAAVTATAAALAVVTAVLGAGAIRGAAARRELRRANLLVAAQEALARGLLGDSRRHARIAPPDADRAREMLGEAIDLAPDIADAYVVRGLCPGAPLEQDLADFDAARARGVGDRTYHLARAFAFHLFGRLDDQAAEERTAEGLRDAPNAADLYLQGRLALAMGRHREAVDLLTESLRWSQASGFGIQAHFARALAREMDGDLGGAIEDLAALREAGDLRPTIGVRMASLRRRSGDAERAETMFSEMLVEVRAGGDAEAWEELCAGCRHCMERAWSERATSEAIAAFGDRVGVVRERVPFLRTMHRGDDAFAALAAARNVIRDDVGLRVEEGKLLLDAGKPDEAIASFEEALRREPRRLAALFGIGQAHQAAGRADKALAAYRREVESNPDSAYAHNDLGTFLSDTQGDLATAETEFREAARLQPDFAEAFNNLGCVLDDRGDLDGAAAAFRSAILLAASWSAPHDNLGDVLVAEHDATGAIAEYREAVRLDPNGALAHFNLGQELSEQRDFEGAFQELDRAATLDPKDGEKWNLRGCALEELKRWDEALASFERAAACDPDDPTYSLERGELLLSRRRDWRAALPLLEFAAVHASEKKSDGEEHYEFGLALVFAGRLEDALREMTRAIEIKPAGEQRRMARWDVLTALRRHADALVAAEDDLVHHPVKSEFAWRKALSLASLGRADDARAFAARSLAVEPDPADVFDFAYVCILAGRPDDARTWLAKGAALDGDGDAYQRACICAALGDRADALRSLESAAEKGYFMSSWAPIDTAFDSVADDPRYKAAMAKIVVR